MELLIVSYWYCHQMKKLKTMLLNSSDNAFFRFKNANNITIKIYYNNLKKILKKKVKSFFI